MDIKILGRPAASVNGRQINIPAKGYVLLAFLASSRNFAAHVQEIRTVLWPESSEEASGAALRQLSARIRKQTMGYDFTLAKGTVRTLLLSSIFLDVARLSQVLKTVSQSADLGSRVDETADEILILYRGDLLEGIEFEGGLEEELWEWISVERARYRSHVLGALRRLLAAPNVNVSVANKIVQRLVEDDPADDAAWIYRLKQALAGHGKDTPEYVYNSCRTAYEKTGCTKPPRELQDLREKLDGARRQERDDARSHSNTVTQRKKSQRPLLLLTQALNGYGLEPIDLSLYDRIASALASYRSYEIVELCAGKNLILGDATEAYAVHVGPRSISQLGFWLSLVNPQQRSQPSARLSGRLMWAGLVEKAEGARLSIDRQLTLVVRTVVSEIERAERDKFGAEDRASAYRLYLAAQADVHRVDLAGLRRARSRFRDALKLDDGYAPALSGMSRTYLMEWLIRGDPDSNYLHEAWRLAGLAVSADRDDGRSIHRLAHVELYRRDYDRSLELFDRAISANPSDSTVSADFADALGHAGRPLQALEMLDEISETDPIVPENHHWIRGSTEYTLDRFQDAVDSFMKLPDPSSAARPMAAALAMCGRTDEASKYVSVVRENYPSFRVADWIRMVPNKDIVDQDRYATGLVEAGL